jgi:hypothetical protein
MKNVCQQVIFHLFFSFTMYDLYNIYYEIDINSVCEISTSYRFFQVYTFIRPLIKMWSQLDEERVKVYTGDINQLPYKFQ